MILTPVQSLLVLHDDFNEAVKPFHKSFPDVTHWILKGSSE